jgi:hypothetical protein
MGGGASAAAAAIARAIKASGVIVQVSPDDFQLLLARSKEALVVHAEGGIFSKKHKYLMSHKGFAFYTRTSEPISLPSHVETVQAAKIWIPG